MCEPVSFEVESDGRMWHNINFEIKDESIFRKRSTKHYLINADRNLMMVVFYLWYPNFTVNQYQVPSTCVQNQDVLSN